MSSDNRTVIVTGAAGDLAKIVAKAIADLGENLVLVDLQRESLEGAFGSENEHRSFVDAIFCEIAQATRVAPATLARFGRIDVLCNIAGGFRMGAPVHETRTRTGAGCSTSTRRTRVHAVRRWSAHAGGGRGRIVNVGVAARGRRAWAPTPRRTAR